MLQILRIGVQGAGDDAIADQLHRAWRDCGSLLLALENEKCHPSAHQKENDHARTDRSGTTRCSGDGHARVSAAAIVHGNCTADAATAVGLTLELAVSAISAVCATRVALILSRLATSANMLGLIHIVSPRGASNALSRT